MDVPHPASVFGRHEFVVRRLHSLLGLMPLGGYLCFHLATNAAVLDGAETYQRRADQIHVLGPTTLLVLEWSVIFLPILFHGVVGMIIVTRGKRNLSSYPYLGNFRYTVQRATGAIAFGFILWHVFHMHGWFRFEWWIEHLARPLGGAQFDPHHAAATAAGAIRDSLTVQVLYAVGVLAAVYHLANGLWTMGITWGVWTSPHAQRWANFPCAAFGVVLAVVGLAALVSMARLEPTTEETGHVAVAATHHSDPPGVGWPGHSAAVPRRTWFWGFAALSHQPPDHQLHDHQLHDHQPHDHQLHDHQLHDVGSATPPAGVDAGAKPI